MIRALCGTFCVSEEASTRQHSDGSVLRPRRNPGSNASSAQGERTHLSVNHEQGPDLWENYGFAFSALTRLGFGLLELNRVQVDVGSTAVFSTRVANKVVYSDLGLRTQDVSDGVLFVTVKTTVIIWLTMVFLLCNTSIYTYIYRDILHTKKWENPC